MQFFSFAIGFLFLFPLFIRISGLPVPLPIGFLLVVALVLVRLMSINTIKTTFLFPTTWMILTLLYTISTGLSLLTGAGSSARPFMSLLVALQMLIPIVSFYLLFNFLNTRQKFVSFALGGYIATFIFSSIVLLSKHNIFLVGTFESVHPVLFGPFEFYQFRQYYGIVLSSGMLLGLHSVKLTSSPILLLSSSLVIVVAVSEMYTTSGFLMSLLAFGLISRIYFRKRTIAILSLLLFSVILLLGFGDSLQQYIILELVKASTAGNRLGIWSESWGIISAHPFFGNGFVFDTIFSVRLHSGHSQIFNIWSRAGIFTLLIWLAIICYALNRARKLRSLLLNNADYFGYRGLLLSLIMLTCLSSLIVPVFEQPYSGSVIWALIALVERSHRLKREQMLTNVTVMRAHV